MTTIRNFRSRWETAGIFVGLFFFATCTLPLFIFGRDDAEYAIGAVLVLLVAFCVGKPLLTHCRTYIRYDSDEIILSSLYRTKRIPMKDLKWIQEVRLEDYQVRPLRTISEYAWDFRTNGGDIFRVCLNLSQKDSDMKRFFAAVRRSNRAVQIHFIKEE